MYYFEPNYLKMVLGTLGQDVSLSFLYRFCKLWWILTDLRTKEIYQVPSFISTRLQDEKGWCLGEKHLFKDGGDCSEEPIPAAVWSCVHPICPSEPLDSCWEYIFPYSQVAYCQSSDLDHGGGSAHNAELKWLFLDKHPKPELTLEIPLCLCFSRFGTPYPVHVFAKSQQEIIQCVIPWVQHWKGHAKDNILSTWHYLRDRFV